MAVTGEQTGPGWPTGIHTYLTPFPYLEPGSGRSETELQTGEQELGLAWI